MTASLTELTERGFPMMKKWRQSPLPYLALAMVALAILASSFAVPASTCHGGGPMDGNKITCSQGTSR